MREGSNLILEGLHESRLNEKEDFVVDTDLKTAYCVYMKPVGKDKPRFFKELSDAEKFAKKKLSNLKSGKPSIVPKDQKEVIISQGDKIIKTFKVNS